MGIGRANKAKGRQKAKSYLGEAGKKEYVDWPEGEGRPPLPVSASVTVDGQASEFSDSVAHRDPFEKVDCSGHTTPPASNSSPMPCHAMKGRCKRLRPGFLSLLSRKKNRKFLAGRTDARVR
jgi:hypothetical protein